ncbi:MAG: hypothetical protein GWN62_33040 [Aliifodinibius sp.]|nr:hypothetical protein [Fodinibius sp.]
MNELTITAAVLFGILIRFGIPIMITFGLAWLLRRMDERWRAEAEESAAQEKYEAQQAALQKIWLQQPCWEIKNCPREHRSLCKAFINNEIPCWETFRSNGSLSPRCKNCEYQKTLHESIDINN